MFKRFFDFLKRFKKKDVVKKEQVENIKLKTEELQEEPGLRFYRRLRQLARQHRRASQHYNRN